jgi:hypothetical protein
VGAIGFGSIQFGPREEYLKLLTSLVLFLSIKSSFSNKFRRILGLMLLYIRHKGYYPFYIYIYIYIYKINKF